MKKISTATIRAINKIEPTELESHGVIEAARSSGYICRFCGHGTNSGKGVDPLVGDSHVGWHCFKCGESFNNLRLLAEHYGLNPANDFEQLVQQTCSEFNIPLDYEDFDSPCYGRRKKARAAKKAKEVTESELKFIREDLKYTPDETLKNFVAAQYKQLWRGLPIDLLLKFGCKLIFNWTPPKNRCNFNVQTNRMIIPTGDGKSSYLARLIDSPQHYGKFRESVEERIKEYGGVRKLFNPAALLNPGGAPVLVFEGEIDALSAIHTGFSAVAVGGCGNYRTLLDAIDELTNINRRPQFVIVFDDDDTGRLNAPKLHEALINIGFSACVRYLPVEPIRAEHRFTKAKLDANFILENLGVDELRWALQETIDSSLGELAAVEKFLSDKKSARANNETLDALFSGDASDLDFAYRLETFRGDRVRWLADDERWLTFAGGLWTRGNSNAAVAHFGRELAETMMEYAQTDEERALAAKFKTAKKIGQAITLLKTCDSIRITADDLDQHNELLNVKNGVINLQDGKLYPHDSSLLLTRQVNANFDLNADLSLVKKFFSDIQPDEMTRRALIRWLGYSLTGSIKEEKFAVWTGSSGANGKSTLAATMIHLLGGYACELPTKALLRKRFDNDADKATTALNLIEGVRFAICEELPQGGELDVALVKNLTGGDRLPLRRNFCEYRIIEPLVKLNLSGNFTPKLPNVKDGGILRRLINFSFDVQFGRDKAADPLLKRKLLDAQNLSALLTLLVREAVAWYRGDDGGLIISDKMKEATREHIAQNDFIAEFASENYILVESATVKAKDFLDALKNEYPRETSRFSRSELVKLVEQVLKVTYCEGYGHKRIFKGIGRLAEDDFCGDHSDEPNQTQYPDEPETPNLPFDEDDLPFD